MIKGLWVLWLLWLYSFSIPEVSGVTFATKENYSILIADDDSSSREALRDIMAHEGYQTVLASCGEEAVDLIREAPVHLAVLDMHMNTLTGLETLHLARQIHNALPAILVTGDPTENIIRQAHQALVYSVLPKPVNKSMVLYTVMRALKRFYGSIPGGD